MEKLIIKVINKEKAQMLSEILSALNFVSSVERVDEKTNISQDDEDFFSVAGLWENRNITTDSIRQELWRKEVK